MMMTQPWSACPSSPSSRRLHASAQEEPPGPGSASHPADPAVLASELPVPLSSSRFDEGALWEQSIVAGNKEYKLLLDLSRKWGGTCGSSLWCASTALVQWLSKPAQRNLLHRLIQDRTVLELGAGVGLVGMFAAKRGAKSVLVTDQPQQLPLLVRNVAANFAPQGEGAADIRAAVLEWGSIPEQIASQDWEVVVGADLVYDEDCVRSLSTTLALLLARGGSSACALLALPDRMDFQYCSNGELWPDYRMLTDALLKSPHAHFHVQCLSSISSEEAGTCSSRIDVLLVTKKQYAK